MVWRDEEGAGFTEPGVEPWLPIGPRNRNVADQRDDPSSILTLTRDLIALRKHRRLLHGAYEPVDSPPGVWAFRREGGAFVALNLGDATGTPRGRRGRDRDRQRPGTGRRGVERSARVACARGGRRFDRVMAVVGIDHCVIAVSDWDRSNAFYRDVVGAELVRREGGWVTGSATSS